VSFEDIIPLFPLGVVLLPGMDLPLHIFEERYKKLVGECIETDKEFGVVYYSGKMMLRVGCTAEISKVLKSYEDGKMDILTTGMRRFHIQELFESKPYIEAKVEFIRDVEEMNDEDMKSLIREGADSLRQLYRMSDDKERDLSYMDPESLSFYIASTQGFTLDEQQRFLEMKSTRERLQKGIESLQKIIERLRLSKEIKRIFGRRDDQGEITPL
jgi:Lon protease-like protein